MDDLLSLQIEKSNITIQRMTSVNEEDTIMAMTEATQAIKEEDMADNGGDDIDDDDDDEDDDDEDMGSAAALVAAAEAAAHDMTDGSPEAIAAAVAAATAEGQANRRRRASMKKGIRPWNDMLFELLKHRFLHGNVMVPFKSGGDLGKWVAIQRTQYMALQKAIQAKQENNEEELKKWTSATMEGGSERLTEERMKVLSSIGFVWDVVQVKVTCFVYFRNNFDKGTKKTNHIFNNRRTMMHDGNVVLKN